MHKPGEVTVFNLQPGDVVDVFRRYSQDTGGYFKVSHHSSGKTRPCIGMTDGWTEAVICRAWDYRNYDERDPRTWVEVHWCHDKWYNRFGHGVSASTLSRIYCLVLPDQIRLASKTGQLQKPELTLFHIRWGGRLVGEGYSSLKSPLYQNGGGYVADAFIDDWERNLYARIGPNYEVVSVFVGRSEELECISPELLRLSMRGRHAGALYFLWPITFQDGHAYRGYVDHASLLKLMGRMEASGIPTRFPHPAHLYRMLVSKEWTARTCLHPLLRVPLTVSVSRESVVLDARKAALGAMDALMRLAQTRAAWSDKCSPSDQYWRKFDGKGVAKLGFSWEAMDVMCWETPQELEDVLLCLAEQRGSLAPVVLVQEWVDFDFEMRSFVVEADLSKPLSQKPRATFYTNLSTVNESRNRSGTLAEYFKEYNSCSRNECIALHFQQDDVALWDAEQQAETLIVRWLQWLQAQSHELPTVIRFDLLVKRVGPGKAAVMTGELTELGGAFLGWEEGPQIVFGAIARSCISDSDRAVFAEPITWPVKPQLPWSVYAEQTEQRASTAGVPSCGSLLGQLHVAPPRVVPPRAGLPHVVPPQIDWMVEGSPSVVLPQIVMPPRNGSMVNGSSCIVPPQIGSMVNGSPPVVPPQIVMPPQIGSMVNGSSCIAPPQIDAMVDGSQWDGRRVRQRIGNDVFQMGNDASE